MNASRRYFIIELPWILDYRTHNFYLNSSTCICQSCYTIASSYHNHHETTAGRTNPIAFERIRRMRAMKTDAYWSAINQNGSATSGQALVAIHVYDHDSADRHRRRRSPGHHVVASPQWWSIDHALGLPQTHRYATLRFLLGKRSWRSLIAALHECAK